MLTHLFTSSILLFVFAAGFYVFLLQSPPLALRRRVLLLGILGAVMLPLLPAPSFPSVLPSGNSPERLVEEWVYFEPAASIASANVPTEEFVGAAAGAKKALSPVQLITFAYLLGALLLLGRMVFGLLRLQRIRRRSRSTGERDIRILSGRGEAFTFGRTVYLSQAVYDAADAPVIIAHERAHASQLHTADALLAEVLRAVFWFHPLAWWLRDQVQINLEYLADAAVLRAGYDRRDYQLSLVTHQQGTDFRTSLLPQFAAKGLKRRIRMMGFKPGSLVKSLSAIGGLILASFITFACLTGQGAIPLEAGAEEAVSKPGIAPLFNGEATELDVFFKRLPTPAEVGKIRPYLKEYFRNDLLVYQTCSEPNGTYQLILGPANTTTHTGSTNWTTDYYTDQPIRFKLTKDGSGSTGGSTFLPMPAPEDAPDEDVLLRVNGEWISVALPGSGPYTSATLDRPILATKLDCLLGVTPENKDNGHLWKASKSVLPIESQLKLANSTLKDNGLDNLPRTYYVGDQIVDEEVFAAYRSGERNMLYLAARSNSDDDNVVVMVANQ